MYFFAIVSDKPNWVMASFANASTLADISPKVTSTTFCTSARSDPSSVQDFPNATIAPTLSTDATVFAILLKEFDIRAVWRSTCEVVCDVILFTFSSSSRYGFVYASIITWSFSSVIPSVSRHLLLCSLRLSVADYAALHRHTWLPWPIQPVLPSVLSHNSLFLA